MIDQQILDMLEDPDPQVRVRAVKQLAKTQTHEAIQYLALVYKEDDDPEVRELARKAGLYIKRKQTEDMWTGGEGNPNLQEPEEPVDEVAVPPHVVETSKGNMDTAMNLHVAGDDAKAARFVEKAFVANPNLKNDPYYLGLASTILGVPGDKVADVLLVGVEYDESGKAKRKPKRKNDEVSEDEVTGSTVAVDLLIYFVVVAGLVIVGLMILIAIFNSSVQTAMAESPEFAAMMSGELTLDPADQMFVDAVNGIIHGGFAISLVGGIVFGIYSTIVLVMQLGCMHIVATMMLGGEGTFNQLLHKVTGVITVFTVAYVLLLMLSVYLSFNSMLMNDESTMGIVAALQGLMGLGGIAYFVWFLMALGKVYNFGTGASCGTMFIGSILFGIATGIISATLSAGMTPLFLNMMGGSPSGF